MGRINIWYKRNIDFWILWIITLTIMNTISTFGEEDKPDEEVSKGEKYGTNLPADPGFEEIKTVYDKWSKYGEGYAFDEDVKHSGKRSIRIEANDPNKLYGVSQGIVSKEPIDVLIIGGWCKAEELNGACYIYLDIYLEDETDKSLLGQTATFRNGTYDWKYIEKEIKIDNKPIKYINIYVIFRYGTASKVWFDDIYVGVKQATKEITLDGITIDEKKKE